MSGLTVFFRDYLPAAECNKEEEEAPDYHASIITRRSNNDHDDVHDDDDDAAAAAAAVGDSSSSPMILPQTDEDMAWNAWREKRKDLVYLYMEHRIVTKEVGDDDDDDSNNNKMPVEASESLFEESQPEEEEELETQQQHIMDKDEEEEEEEDSREKGAGFRFGRTPHTSETLHTVNYLADIGLYTKTLSLSLCEVDKVWNLRDTKRQAVKQALPRRHPIYASCPQLPRLARNYCDEDGPLDVCFRNVVTLEARQLDSTPSELRQRAEHIQETVAAKRVKIFFYNAYAKAIASLLQQRPVKSKLLFGLQNVPAKCIIPYSVSDWFDRHDQAECCLCLGDTSGLKVDYGEEGLIKIRFDEEGMRLFFGWVDKDDNVQEWQLDPDKEEGVSKEKITTTDGQLATQYSQWKMAKPGPRPAERQDEVSKKASGPHPAERQDNEVSKKAPAAHGQNDKGQEPKEVNRSLLTEFEEEMEEEPKQKEKPSAVVNRSEVSAANGNRLQERDKADKSVGPQAGQNGARRNGTFVSTPRSRKRSAAGTPKSSSSRKRELVKYDRLADLRGIYESHRSLSMDQNGMPSEPCLSNLYGAVLGFGSPILTKRGDWMVGVALVDDSLPLAAENGSLVEFVHTVNVNIFTKKKEDLPDIRCAGDILRLHRVKVQEWKGEIQLLGMRASSYVVFRGDANDPAKSDDWSIIPTAKSEFALKDRDLSHFVDLWRWVHKRLLSHPTMKLSVSFKLSDMKRQGSETSVFAQNEDVAGDLTVMVAAIIPVPDDQVSGIVPRGFLRVWDGTGFPESDPLPLPSAVNAIKNGDPPSEALVKIAGIVDKIRFIKQDPDLQPPKAVTGRVANVAVWENSHWDLVTKAVPVGSFIRLRNVQDTLMQNDLRCLMVHSKSYLTPLPNLTYEVVHLLQEHNDRLLRNEPINPQSGVLPLETTEQAATGAAQSTTSEVPEGPDEPAPGVGDTLQDEVAGDASSTCNRLQSLVSGPIPTFFSGNVKIAGTIPPLSTLLSSGGLEQICTSRADGGLAYRFAVCIEDSSAQLVAVASDDGNVGYTLMGMPASDAIRDSSGALFNLQKVIEDRSFIWEAKVSSVEYQGAKYFLLHSLKEIA